jgi:hypothetical protein
MPHGMAMSGSGFFFFHFGQVFTPGSGSADFPTRSLDIFNGLFVFLIKEPKLFPSSLDWEAEVIGHSVYMGLRWEV